MAFAPRSLILFALPMRLPLPSDSFFLLFEQTFQMRVAYTDWSYVYTGAVSWIYLSNEGGIHPSSFKSLGLNRWIYLSNEGGIHLFVGIQLSHLYLRYLPSE